jgi:hypothetical protein
MAANSLIRIGTCRIQIRYGIVKVISSVLGSANLRDCRLSLSEDSAALEPVLECEESKRNVWT